MKVITIVWNYLKKLGSVLWFSVRDGAQDKIFRMSAALAFYTIFSIAPILILMINIADKFVGRSAVEGEIFGQLRNLVGDDAALQIQSIIANSMLSEQFSITTAISIGVLMFTATGVFTEIQDSINVIWKLKPKPKKHFIKMIVNRLISFSMMVALGVLVLLTFVINVILDKVGSRIEIYFPGLSVIYAAAINYLITLLSTVLFFWRHIQSFT
jgi:membrane protein